MKKLFLKTSQIHWKTPVLESLFKLTFKDYFVLIEEVLNPGNKGNKRNTRKRCEACSKLTIKTPERHQWRRSGVFIVKLEHISHLALGFLLLTLSR